MTHPEPVLSVSVTPQDCPSPHSLGNKLARVAWGAVWLLLFRPSPRVAYGWRRWLLRLFGAHIGPGAKIMPSTRVWAPWNLTMGAYACLSHDVDCYCVAPIRIGDQATVSQYAFLCAATHDITDPHMRLLTAPIVIADQAWVCARAFIGPGVTLHTGSVAGACSVVTKDVAAWQIVAGNPAKFIRLRELSSR